jgi:hypothetical protein
MVKKLLFFLAIVAFLGCKKDPGFGGNATIRGSVWVKDYNSTFTTLIGEYAGKDVYVYIVYGDHVGYDKRVKTDYNGDFEFPFLYEGEYKVYVYSLDSAFTDLSGTKALVKEVKLEEKKEVKELEPFVILQ